MVADGSVNFDTKIDGSGFSKGLEKLGNIAKSSLKVVSGLVGGVASALGGAAVAGVKYNAKMEQYSTSFSTMLGGASKAQGLISQLKKYAANTPFEFSDLAKGTQTLLSFGIASKDIMPDLKMLGDVSQGNTDKFNALSLAFAQTTSAGKLSGQDLLQYINAGFNPLNEIAKKTGKSMATLRDEMSKGKISAQDVADAFKSATSKGGQFYSAMEAQSKTFAGQMSTLKDNASQFLGDLTQGFENSLKNKALPMVNSWMEQLQQAFSTGGATGVASAFGNVLAQGLQQVAQSLPSVISLASKVISSFAQGISNNMPQIASAAANLIASFGTAITTSGVQLVETGIWLIGEIISGIAEKLPTMATQLGEAIPEIVNDLIQQIPSLVVVGMEFITYLLEGITNSLPDLIEGADSMMDRLVRVIIQNAPKLVEAAGKLMTTFYTALMQQNPPAGIALTVFGAFKGLEGTASILDKVTSGMDKVTKAGGLIGKIKKPIDSVVTSTGKIGSVFGKVGSKLSVGAHTIGSAFSSLFSVLAANPIILIIAGIAALVATIIVLWNTNEGFRNTVIGAWNAIKQTAENVFGAVAGFFTTTIPNAWNSLMSFFSGIPAWWNGLWTQIGQFFTDTWNNIINFFTTTIPTWIASIDQWFQQLPYNLGLALGTAVKAVANFGVSVWNWITTELPKIIQGIIQWFQQLPGKIWTFLVQVVTNIGKWGSNMWSYLSEQIPKIINGIGTWFSQLPGEVWTWLLNTISNISRWGSSMWNTATSAASHTISGIGSWFAQLPGNIWKWLTNIISDIGRWGSQMISKAGQAAKDTADNVVKWFKDLPGKMLDVGKNIIYGIWNGITGAAGWLWNKVTGFCNQFMEGFHKGFDSHSPSRRMEKEIGRWIPPGITVGMDKAMPKALSSVKEQINSMVAQMQSALALSQSETSRIVSSNLRPAFAADGSYSLSYGGPSTVETHIDVDSREFAVATTPAIAKQLGFKGGKA